MPRRRPAARAPTRPWTEEEDAKVREIAEIGLASDLWQLALPRRGFGEIAARRLDLNLTTAPAL